MLRIWCILIGLASLAVSPGLADIIDVTVNGTVSGSGSITTACALITPGCMPDGFGHYLVTASYSYNATNTQLGLFEDSGEADAVNFPADVVGFSEQYTFATSDALDITLDDGLAVAPPIRLSWSVSDSISVGFDLTEPSVIQLVGFGELFVGSGELLDSAGNTILVLPPDSGPVSAAIELEPGIYQLDASEGPGGGVNIGYELDASFTPVAATPEPRGALPAVLLAMMLGGYLSSHRRRIV